MATIKTGIAGGAGYTGGELIRLLIRHPHAELKYIHSKSHAGQDLHLVHHDLLGETDLRFTNDLTQPGDGSLDILFLCQGHGESKKFLGENRIHEQTKIIDLSQDYRLLQNAGYGSRRFVYGLPELNRETIKKSSLVANPGCFATCIALGLLPLANAGLLHNIYTTGITGSTGAGQGLSHSTHFSWRSGNIQAYKTFTHQHLNEVYESLHRLQNSFPEKPSGENGIHFVPWRGDFTRGIFVSSQLTMKTGIDELNKIFEEYYRDHPFVQMTNEPVFLKQVVNTNKAVIQLEKEGNSLVVHSVIDNLLKGASGQAVQNMNLICGLEETEGLKLKANYF